MSFSLTTDARETFIFAAKNVFRDYETTPPAPEPITGNTWDNVTGNEVKEAALALIRDGKDPAKDKSIQELLLRWQLSQSGIFPVLAAENENQTLINEFNAAVKGLEALTPAAEEDAQILANAASRLTIPNLGDSYSGSPRDAMLHAGARVADARLSKYAEAAGTLLYLRGIQVQGEHMTPNWFALAPLTFKDAHRHSLRSAGTASPWTLAHARINIEPAANIEEIQERINAYTTGKRAIERQVEAALPQWQNLPRDAYQDAITRAVNGETMRDARGGIVTWAN
ncbi:hypothetical protein [Galactobacter valiniphilus]|uniref:hypothetical protein n=1 Tax=Galactobacter valiniphilus TaxID=2676122 RepID=UPI00373524E2